MDGGAGLVEKDLNISPKIVTKKNCFYKQCLALLGCQLEIFFEKDLIKKATILNHFVAL